MNKSDSNYDFTCIASSLISILIKNSQLPINCLISLILIVSLWSRFDNILSPKSIMHLSFKI